MWSLETVRIISDLNASINNCILLILRNLINIKNCVYVSAFVFDTLDESFLKIAILQSDAFTNTNREKKTGFSVNLWVILILCCEVQCRGRAHLISDITTFPIITAVTANNRSATHISISAGTTVRLAISTDYPDGANTHFSSHVSPALSHKKMRPPQLHEVYSFDTKWLRHSAIQSVKVWGNNKKLVSRRWAV